MLINQHYRDTSKPASKNRIIKRRFSGQQWEGVGEQVLAGRSKDKLDSLYIKADQPADKMCVCRVYIFAYEGKQS
jgi:hypothetical protein